ncbi:acyl carrier protein [Stackebrandtia nassauensis]|uniref:Carrier domain-containing protein n=1 Tax=Stackebrandtia nassauensis (strain DSM 44728 / CIP 108903 / NRRL B-16338 / NBRC 102104 / LLR-40K-21) TaxID=446470 RepID=D3PVL9_STANL|nr:acyl carrier protein [Stackebrandtia nassauensis]ADD43133.1 hypothetical protein Snas_3469 [Stackebrandtia nassauensis DSM 44728]
MTPQQAHRMVTDALRRIAPDIDVNQIHSDEDLRDAGQLDSLDFLSFVELLSTDSGVRIDEDDYPALGSIAAAVDFLCDRSASHDRLTTPPSD